jgi:hypothetical protein
VPNGLMRIALRTRITSSAESVATGAVDQLGVTFPINSKTRNFPALLRG